jgi:hypothetical protein
MTSYLKSAFAIFLLVAFTKMDAQIRPGYIFGLNVSNMTLKANGISYDPETLVAVHFGGSVEIPVTENFAFQPGLLFSAKGSNYKINTLEYTISPVYIEVPVNVLFSFGSDVVKVALFAGPYFACGIRGYKIDSGGNLKDINYGSGENKDLKSFDTGLNFGAGVYVRGFLISVRYEMGLTNISPVTTLDSEMKNKVIGISIIAGSQGLSAKFGQ